MSLLIWNHYYHPLTAVTSLSRHIHRPFIHLHLTAIQTPLSVGCRRLRQWPPPWHTQWCMALLSLSGRTQSCATPVCENATLHQPLFGFILFRKRPCSHWTQRKKPDWIAAWCSNCATDHSRNNSSNDQDAWSTFGLLWALSEFRIVFSFLSVRFHTVCRADDKWFINQNAKDCHSIW